MRKKVFWAGWSLMFLAPIAAIIEIAVYQDMPVIEPWKLAIPVVALVLIALGRNRDDVLKHHLA